MSDTDCNPPRNVSRIAAARRHQRAKEPMCDECRKAWSEKNHRDYLKRKAAKS